MSRRALAFLVSVSLAAAAVVAVRRTARRRAAGHQHGSPDHWPAVARKPAA